MVGAPRLINPLFAALNEADADLSRLVYSGLLRYDREQRLVPDLAVGYEIGPDKKQYTFKLKEAVVWHDGEPFTAQDVVFTIEALQDSEVGSPLAVSFQGVKAEALDDRTVKFTLAEPFPGFLSVLTVGIIPEHTWSGIPRPQFRLAEVNLKPIGTGPFAFKRLIKDDTGFISRYELARFAGYYRQPPFLKEFIFQYYSDYDGDQGAIAALREQKINGLNFLPFEFRERVKNLQPVKLYTMQLPQYTALFLNQGRREVLSDNDVRRSLAIALDRGEILKATLANEGELINGPILSGFPGYDSTLSGPAYSVDEANALLDKKWRRVEAAVYREERQKELWKQRQSETGSSMGTSTPEASETGVATSTAALQAAADIDKELDAELSAAQLFYRRSQSGTLLTVDLVTADTPEYKQAAELIAGYWQDIGIKTKIKYVSPKDMPRAVLKDRAYDALLYRVIVGGDPDQYAFWHSSQADHPGLNLSRYNNPKVDELLLKLRQTDDAAEAAKFSADLQTQILHDVPAVFLYTPTYTYVLDESVRGFNVSRVAHPADRFANVIEWYNTTDGRWK